MKQCQLECDIILTQQKIFPGMASHAHRREREMKEEGSYMTVSLSIARYLATASFSNVRISCTKTSVHGID